MKEKKRIDYMYFYIKNGKSRKATAELSKVVYHEKEWGGIRLLQIEVGEKKYRKEGAVSEQKKRCITEKCIRRIEKRLQKYEIKNSVIGADVRMAEELQLGELLFQARKQELLSNLEQIFFVLELWKIPRKEGWDRQDPRTRSTMLLVVGSAQWNSEELLAILLAAKDHYEELYVVSKTEDYGIECMVQQLYEDWGIVLHVMGEKMAMTRKMDVVLFLVEEWNLRRFGKYQFDMAYLVEEAERDGRFRKHSESLTEMKRSGKAGTVYSGLVYQKQGERLPYHMAVNMAFQKPDFYKECDVSIVGMYDVYSRTK